MMLRGNISAVLKKRRVIDVHPHARFADVIEAKHPSIVRA
jgi:hypothetical protein